MRPALLCFVLTFTSCAATPSLLFTSFGRADPAGDAEIVDDWTADRALLIKNARQPDALVKLKNGREITVREFAKKRVDATRQVEVLVDTMPSGLEVTDRGASVKDGAGITIIGRFIMRYPAEVSLRQALDDVKVLTNAAEGNIAVVSWLRASQTHTAGVVGLVLKANEGALDLKNLKSGRINEI